jgi:hypothetical protein
MINVGNDGHVSDIFLFHEYSSWMKDQLAGEMDPDGHMLPATCTKSQDARHLQQTPDFSDQISLLKVFEADF